MPGKAMAKISLEDMQQMIKRYVEDSKSIYAPSGPPDHRLEGFFVEVSSDERTVRLVSSAQVKIDVTFLLDLEPLSGTDPEILRSMENILLHDGHRRLASCKISVDESSYHDNPARLVYSCARSSKSRIKKFVNAWKKTA